MQSTSKNTEIAYRCPECGHAVLGLMGKFTHSFGMLRLKCECQGSFADITPVSEEKIKFSVPCPLCKQNHTYTVASSIIFNRESFPLSCPYSNTEIAFIGTSHMVSELMKENEEKLTKLLSDLELETLSDIQPEDMSDEEILPDASVYDTVRLVLKELEYDKKADCPCHRGNYDIRYTDNGLQAFCPDCGATYNFECHSSAATEEFLNLDEIKLS